MKMHILSRRDFLRVFTKFLFGLAGLLGLGGLIRFFSYQPDPGPPTEFDLGDAYNFPYNTRTVLPDIPAVIYNNKGIFVAYSLTCTHLGCTIEPDGEEGFTCPCHGSRYTKDGLVLKGPATKPLRQLRLETLEDHTLRLYTN
jgi:cytochrome b6-f complex iron-sulfur subunit